MLKICLIIESLSVSELRYNLYTIKCTNLKLPIQWVLTTVHTLYYGQNKKLNLILSISLWWPFPVNSSPWPHRLPPTSSSPTCFPSYRFLVSITVGSSCLFLDFIWKESSNMYFVNAPFTYPNIPEIVTRISSPFLFYCWVMFRWMTELQSISPLFSFWHLICFWLETVMNRIVLKILVSACGISVLVPTG